MQHCVLRRLCEPRLLVAQPLSQLRLQKPQIANFRSPRAPPWLSSAFGLPVLRQFSPKRQHFSIRARAVQAPSNAEGNRSVLPEPPADANLKTVLPYVWNLAAGDATLSWRLAVALVLLVVSKAAGLVGPVFFKRAMDTLAQPAGAVFSSQSMQSAVLKLVLAALSKAVSAGLNELRYLVFAPLGQSTGRRVGVQLLEHILYLDLAFHLERKTGALTRILDRAQRSVVNIFRAVGTRIN